MSNVFHIFANAALGKGLSGGDRIFIELSRRLSIKYPIFIHVWKEGYEMCKRQGLYAKGNLRFKVLNLGLWCNFGFAVCYLARIILAVKQAIFLKVPNNKSEVLYSASEFWMDSLPAFILKLRFTKTIWIAGWFQTAPNPFVGFTKGNRENKYKISALLYWLMQLPIKPLIQKFADFVMVNNDLEKYQFPRLRKEKRVLVMLGAVNIEKIERFRKNYQDKVKIYDAVFEGRFHPQKGVLELIDIWKLVTKEIPTAKLAMIGDGPLMENVKSKIKSEKLEKNIKLFGWVFDGPKKYRIFSQSKLVVHPAFFDSGGMASAEAMAFGLPCVGFDLESFKSYYPKGMIKVKVGDFKEFANMIIKLLTNKKERDKVGYEAQKMILEDWSWDQRVDQLMNALKISTKNYE